MLCLCGHGESCGICDGTSSKLKERIYELERENARLQRLLEISHENARILMANPERCPHYWGRHDMRCVRRAGHSGKHEYEDPG